MTIDAAILSTGEHDVGHSSFLRQAARQPGLLVASLFAGFAVGVAYRVLFDPAVERDLINFARSGLQGAGVALAVLAVQIGFASGAQYRLGSTLRRLPLPGERHSRASSSRRARRGSIGAFIEDKNSGTILLQQALRRQMPAQAIDSKLTAMGKDERAISVSGYVHRELVKYTDRAFEKTVIYKRRSRNHLLDQVESFRVGDRDIAVALGNSEGF
jgi:hypothetical protein